MNMRSTSKRCSRGVSLVEALVALAAMGIGMLGIVGMQATLRGNSDLAKQRAEAVRFAQEAVEEWRAITVMGATPNRLAYSQLATTGTAEVIAGSNGSFSRTRIVVPMDSRNGVPEIDTLPRAKSLQVTVSWNDRTGESQSVSLSTAIAGVMPELAATLAVPPDGDPVRQPFGRHRGIPVTAKELGDGSSALKPPGAPGDVAWRFDNVSGVITLCTTTAASTALIVASGVDANLSCSTDKAFLLTGYVRYATQAAQPTDVEPNSPPVAGLQVWVDHGTTRPSALRHACYVQNVATPSTYTAYLCAVPVVVQIPPLITSWSGRVFFEPDALFVTDAADPAAPYKVCRYLANGVNADGNYAAVTGPLVFQNYLVIRASNSCPNPPTSVTPHQSTAYPDPA